MAMSWRIKGGLIGGCPGERGLAADLLRACTDGRVTTEACKGRAIEGRGGRASERLRLLLPNSFRRANSANK